MKPVGQPGAPGVDSLEHYRRAPAEPGEPGAMRTFFTDKFKGARLRLPPALGRARSELDKGTLAAAHIGLVRAGQRLPDRRTATGRRPLPSPLLRPRRIAGNRMVQARRSSETMTTRAAASVGNDGGRPVPGASARAEPCRAGALRARRADAWRAVPAPKANGPAATRPPAPAPRVKQRLTVDGPAVGRQSARPWGHHGHSRHDNRAVQAEQIPGAVPECWRGPGGCCPAVTGAQARRR